MKKVLQPEARPGFKLAIHWCQSDYKSEHTSNRSYILAWEFVTRSCLKPRNPCSNHEIHVLFEHGFYLKKRKLGPDMHV